MQTLLHLVMLVADMLMTEIGFGNEIGANDGKWSVMTDGISFWQFVHMCLAKRKFRTSSEFCYKTCFRFNQLFVNYTFCKFEKIGINFKTTWMIYLKVLMNKI